MRILLISIILFIALVGVCEPPSDRSLGEQWNEARQELSESQRDLYDALRKENMQ